MTLISFVIPTHNNLEYVQNAYNSIRKYNGNDHEIIILDDNSTKDNTIEWLKSIKKKDKNFKYILNETGKIKGHTILYDEGVKLSSNTIFSIFHADMFIGPNYVTNLIKNIEEKCVVAATRVEPPLHYSAKDKIIQDFGTWPDEFKEEEFINFCNYIQTVNKDQVCPAIFAPWLMYKKDFIEIGGHDRLFAPYPHEDSDLFNRLMLAGFKIKQARDALVYHYTCRGHRWTDGKLEDHDDYQRHSINASRNYLRKWGSWIVHDKWAKPIVPHKYNITLDISNCTYQILEIVEPYFDQIYCDLSKDEIQYYIKNESEKTLYSLNEKIKNKNDYNNIPFDDIMLIFDGLNFNRENFNFIKNISHIVTKTSKTGVFQSGNFIIKIREMKYLENNLIKVNNPIFKD